MCLTTCCFWKPTADKVYLKAFKLYNGELNLSEHHLKLTNKQIKQVKTLYKRVIEMNSEHRDAHYQLGILYRNKIWRMEKMEIVLNGEFSTSASQSYIRNTFEIPIGKDWETKMVYHFNSAVSLGQSNAQDELRKYREEKLYSDDRNGSDFGTAKALAQYKLSELIKVRRQAEESRR